MLLQAATVLLVVSAPAFASNDGFVEVKPSSNSVDTDLIPKHTEPQVAMVCEDGKKVVSKFMDENGEWKDDEVYQQTCLTNKPDILDYCKRIYPNKDITNIVESIRTYHIQNWCRWGKAGKGKCRGTFWVKPFRCLQGTFQSEALLVPRKCQFDHLHNSSNCWNFDQWNVSAIDACATHKMSLLSFSVLIPCGVDMWEGVEFVCCPKDDQKQKKINRIMEAWSKMEAKFDEMAKTNEESARAYRKEMTTALRKEVSAVEEEHEEKKRQLLDLHQQRVLKNISERKPEAEKCFMDALNSEFTNTRRLEKCLQKLLRALHKERHHYLSHYRHLLLNKPAEAASIRQLTLGRLVENDLTVNKSLDMLKKKAGLREKLLPLMQQYADALRTKDATPLEDLAHIDLLSRSRETEEAILEAYDREADAKKVREARIKAIHDNNEASSSVEESLNEVEPRKKAKATIKLTATLLDNPVPFPNHVDEDDVVEDERDPIILPAPKPAEEGQDPIHSVSQAIDEQPIVAHALAHELTHDAPSFTVIHGEAASERRSQSVVLAVAFAGIALTLVIGLSVAAIQRRLNTKRSKRGFTVVDQASTPEERHVAKMQINGYENPTYRFFEEEE
ncbi:unnamed protein product [Cyprideis torosa]|uniref:Uncharacterized protein n=1 Tax=Cyprideis torosa TaxID=163714 RepID=A0A7R8WDP3_9CRUS|nr:unnamed protein product [Cyprideis torosa]CAG0894862.1 unnamed protein product [Cyprideis torosa]